MYRCNICGRSLQNPGALNTHLRLKHGESLTQSQEKARLLQQELEELKAKLNEPKQREEKTLIVEVEKPKEQEYQWRCMECKHEFNEFGEDWWGNKVCPNCRARLNVG